MFLARESKLDVINLLITSFLKKAKAVIDMVNDKITIVDKEINLYFPLVYGYLPNQNGERK